MLSGGNMAVRTVLCSVYLRARSKFETSEQRVLGRDGVGYSVQCCGQELGNV